MKKFYFLCTLMTFALPVMAAHLVRGPYVEDPTQSTSILRWQTDEPTVSWLEYGPIPRCNQIMTLSPQGTQHKVALYGLVPNQDFCYHVYVHNAAQDGVQEPVKGIFRTLFSAERKIVNFVAVGDTGAPAQNSEEGLPLADDSAQARSAIAHLLAAERGDFLIHTGNLTHSGLDQDADAEFFTPFAPVLRKMPLFVALGPNEYGKDRNSRASKQFLKDNFRAFHDMSWSNATPKYYSFDTANARFIFLDTNAADDAVWAPNLGEKSSQITWLKSMLSSAGEKWKIVVMHAPAYSSGANGSNAVVADSLIKIFEDNQVNLVLQGGDADYERTFPLYQGETKTKGVTYVTLGTAAVPPTKRDNPHPSTARFVSARHYAVVKIVDRKLSAKVYNDQGKQLDSFDLYL